MKTSKKQIPFKSYSPNQTVLFPERIDDKIVENHPVRVVDKIINNIDITSITGTYKGGGTSSYYPRMLLKVVIYAYLRNVFSSRKIEEALKENIHFMWLSGNSTPDHNTINRFRSDRLKKHLKKIFSMVVMFLIEQNYVSLKEIYIDGTKTEANANKYTFVWGRTVETNTNKIKQQLEELWAYTERVCKEEQELNKPDFDNIDPEKVEQAIASINEALTGKEVDKKVKQKLSYAKKNWPKNLRKYEDQKKILDGRNSYSKTDPDATFMRMKDDHFKNGQLKPAYNWQFSTNNQIIVNYSVTQSTTDTVDLIAHLKEHKDLYGAYPEIATADAGYGSEENYDFMEESEIEPFVKFNYFHKEQSKSFKEDISKKENLHYNKEKDCFYCPMGQVMAKVGEGVRESKTGYKQKVSYYQAQNCKRCPLRGTCHKSKGKRIIEVNHNLERHKQNARERLHSEEGIKYRGQRAADVEAVFGQIKQNKGFRRFMLRGLEKVEIETGLIAIAHNIAKISA